MEQEDLVTQQVDQFVLQEIDSVPHLEALLLLWNTRPKQWPPAEMAHALYISAEETQPILQDLQNRGLLTSNEGRFSYASNPERDELIGSVDRIYRREIVRIANVIHSKASPAVRAFARAFRFKKD